MRGLTMEGLRVTGRGFRSPLVNVTLTADGALVRVDDSEQPELWVELFIPTAALLDGALFCSTGVDVAKGEPK